MKQAKDVQNFFYSQYFSDGLKITLGALVPAVFFSLTKDIPTAITVSLGAIVTSIVDTPGPVRDRRLGMGLLLISIFFISLITKLINHSQLAILAALMSLSFAMCMIAVYGARAASFGTACMLIMILNIDDIKMTSESPVQHALLLTVGAGWYTLLSLAITRFRPFRQTQQELAELLHHIANFVRLKASFYHERTDQDRNFGKLIDEQVTIHQNLDNLRELFFTSKRKVKDTTPIGRLLMVIFNDAIDIFEKTTATHYDYNGVLKNFGQSPALQSIRALIIKLGNEIDNLSYYIYANRNPRRLYNLQQELKELLSTIEEEEINGKNTIILKKITINIRNLSDRINSIYSYFESRDRHVKPTSGERHELDQFETKSAFGFKLLRDNITLKSGTFRHALRMVIVLSIAYFLSIVIPFGHHSYWILMTVLVILKPGFSLTKQRNYQRVSGTIIGGLAGIIILLFIQDEIARFVLLLLLMMLAYSFIRLNYILGVMFLTPYLLIMYSFLGVETIAVLKERVIDTAVGSSLAFFSAYVIFPSWESEHVQESMRKMLISNYNYLAGTLATISGSSEYLGSYKAARQDLYVNMASITSTFQRMITEPKSKQRNAKELNRFVIFNHLLSSYSVALVNIVRSNEELVLSESQVKTLRKALKQLALTIDQISSSSDSTSFKEYDWYLPARKDFPIEQNAESQLFDELCSFVYKTSVDLNRVCEQMDFVKGNQNDR